MAKVEIYTKFLCPYCTGHRFDEARALQKSGGLRRIDGGAKPRRHPAACFDIGRQKGFAHRAQRKSGGKRRL